MDVGADGIDDVLFLLGEGEYRLLLQVVLTRFLGGGAEFFGEGGHLAAKVIQLVESEGLQTGILLHLSRGRVGFPGAVALGVLFVQFTRAAPAEKLLCFIGVHPVDIGEHFIKVLGLAGNDKAVDALGRVGKLVDTVFTEGRRSHISHCEIGVALTHGIVKEVDAAEVVNRNEGIAGRHHVLPALGIDGQEVGQKQALFIELVVELEHFLKLGRSRAKRPLPCFEVVTQETVVARIDERGAPGGCDHVQLGQLAGKGAEGQRVAIRVGFLELDEHIIELILVGGNFEAQFLKDIGTIKPATAVGLIDALLRELVEPAVRRHEVEGVGLIFLIPGFEVRHLIQVVEDIDKGPLRRVLLNCGVADQVDQIRQFARGHGQVQLFGETFSIDARDLEIDVGFLINHVNDIPIVLERPARVGGDQHGYLDGVRKQWAICGGVGLAGRGAFACGVGCGGITACAAAG